MTISTTFGCRAEPVEESDEPTATGVPAAVPYSDGPVFGRKLSRNETLAHARIADFWRLVDFLLENEPAVAHHIYGHRPESASARRGWWRKR